MLAHDPKLDLLDGNECSETRARDDLCDTILKSLVTMASKSKRHQADLSVALRCSGIQASAQEVRDALSKLQSDGLICGTIPLYDGGMLVSVTNRGMDQCAPNSQWGFLEKLTRGAI